MGKRLKLEWGRDGHTTVRGRRSTDLEGLKFATVNGVGGFLYVYGGSIGLGFYRNCLHRYNVVNKTWVQLEAPKELPARSMHSTTLIDDGLFIFGGYSAGHVADTMLRYDITTNTCEALECSGDMPSSRRGHCAEFFEHLNLMLLFGGGNLGVELGSLYSFSVSQRVWKRLRPKGENPTGRYRMGNAKAGLKWYIVGGVKNWNLYEQVFVLDLAPRIPVWSKVAYSGPHPRRYDVPTVYAEGNLIVFGYPVGVLDTREKKWEIPRAESEPSSHVLYGQSPTLTGGFVAPMRGKVYVFTGSSLYQPYVLNHEVIE